MPEMQPGNHVVGLDVPKLWQSTYSGFPSPHHMEFWMS